MNGSNKMIKVSRLNGKEFVINCEMIKTIEATPDSVICLTTGEKIMVNLRGKKFIAILLRIHQSLPEWLTHLFRISWKHEIEANTYSTPFNLAWIY